MAARDKTPGSDTKHLFRLVTSPDRAESSLDQLVAQLKALKDQDTEVRQALEEAKTGRRDGVRALQRRIEHVKRDIAQLDEDRKKQKEETQDIDAQIRSIEGEIAELRKEKKLIDQQLSKMHSGKHNVGALSSSCSVLVKLTLVFLLTWVTVEFFFWKTGQDDSLPELYHAYIRPLLHHHWFSAAKHT